MTKVKLDKTHMEYSERMCVVFGITFNSGTYRKKLDASGNIRRKNPVSVEHTFTSAHPIS